MSTMTIIIIAVLAIAASGGIMSSFVQWRSRKEERKEYQQWIKANAALEIERDDLQSKYDNEVNHRQWAIGRIKDQQALIDQLKKGQRPPYKSKDSHNKELN